MITLRQILLTFVLLYAPRHGKSMLVIHACIFLMIRNPNVRIIYCQGVLKTSIKVMKMIMAELLYNTRLLELFGPFKIDGRQWNNDGFIVARREIESITPTFTPVGVQSNIRSLDADIVIVDDPQDIDRAESETTTQRDYNWLTAELMTRREPHTPVFMVGSHLPTLFGDIFSQLEDNVDDLRTEEQEIIIRKVPAHDLEKCDGEAHTECLLWPDRRSIHFLDAQKAMLGADMFEAVYQQVARIPGQRPFMPEVVKGDYVPGVPNEEGLILPPEAEVKGILDPSRKWKQEVRCCGQVFTTIGFDPAAGEGKRSSLSALHVLAGCIRCKRLYSIDYWEKRQSPDLHAATIGSFAKAFDVSHVRIEINAYQKALARDRELQKYARDHGFVVDEWFTDDRKNTPEFGIPLLARWMNDGLFSVPHQDEEDRQYARELLNSLIRFPLKPNDSPMALWLAAGMMWHVWELYANPEPIRLTRLQAGVPQYLLDNPVKVNLAEIGNRRERSMLDWMRDGAIRTSR
jgi:hypothetical protein